MTYSVRWPSKNLPNASIEMAYLMIIKIARKDGVDSGKADKIPNVVSKWPHGRYFSVPRLFKASESEDPAGAPVSV